MRPATIRAYRSADETDEADEEHLPFALKSDSDDDAHLKTKIISPPILRKSSVSSSQLSSHSQPPPLASSLVSGKSEISEYGGDSSSLLQPDSQYLDTAASMLSSQGSSLFPIKPVRVSTWSPASLIQSSRSSLSVTNNKSDYSVEDVNLSQLLIKADNTLEKSESRLSTLGEDAESGEGDSQFTRDSSTIYQIIPEDPASQSFRPPGPPVWYSRSLFHCSSTEQTIIIPAGSSSFYQSQERRMASLAGATALRTGPNSFEVTIDVSAACSAMDVMDIVGNVDMLRHWCDPVTDILVTNSSEGSASFVNRQSNADREYDGAWVEATTPQLVAPSNTSCLYSTGRLVSVAFGFPTYGKITLFSERQRHQVGLTIGPFPGDVEVVHKIKIQKIGDQRLRIVDTVKVRNEDVEHYTFCGIFDAIEKFFLPGVDSYIDQVLSSMARLRFLVENGESLSHSGKVGSSFCSPLVS